MAREATKAEKEVFGHDVQIDPATNRPIEQGIGSPKQRTLSHAQAMLKDATERKDAKDIAEAKKLVAALQAPNDPTVVA